MKTTIELPAELFVAAKRKAAEERSTLKSIIERGLRRELARPPARSRRPAIKWVTEAGGLPAGIDVSNRAAMHEGLRAKK